VLARLKLERRTCCEIWHPGPSEEDSLDWLRRTYSQVNNGRRTDVPIPKRITVLIPLPVLEQSPYSVCLVDTKGIDGPAAARPDLTAYFDDSRALVVLCSSFNDAPDSTSQLVLQHIAETSPSDRVAGRLVLLVLPREGEPLNVRDDSGNLAGTAAEGNTLREHDIATSLRMVGSPRLPIWFWSPDSDASTRVAQWLVERIAQVREAHAERIRAVTEVVRDVARDLQDQRRAVAQAEALRRVAIFVQQHAEGPRLQSRVHDRLLEAIRTQHPRTVWASVRRLGSWLNLDVYYYLGAGAEIGVRQAVQEVFDGLRELLENMRGDDSLGPAHGLLGELLLNARVWRDRFIEEVRQAGQQTFRLALRDASQMWKQCESRYGQGPGFRENVASDLDQWFRGNEVRELRDRLDSRIRTAWDGEVLGPMRQLCDSTASTGPLEAQAGSAVGPLPPK